MCKRRIKGFIRFRKNFKKIILYIKYPTNVFIMIIQYRQLNNDLAFIDLFLWISSVSITFLIILYTINKFRLKKDEWEQYQKENVITWIIFLTCIGIGNTLSIIWRFTIQDNQVAEIVDYISIILVYIALLVKILNIERGINRSNFYRGYYFSIVILITIIFAIIANPLALKTFGPLQIIYFILMTASFLVFPGIFVYLAIKSTGNARIDALKVSTGSFIIGIGLLVQPQNIEGYARTLVVDFELFLNFITIVCPILITLGIILIYTSFRGTL